MKNRDKIVLGMIAAAAVGTAIGLLFYTDGGKKARKKIKHKADDWADSMGSLIASGKENLKDLKNKAIKEARHGFKKAKHKAEEGYQDLSDEIEAKIS